MEDLHGNRQSHAGHGVAALGLCVRRIAGGLADCLVLASQPEEARGTERQGSGGFTPVKAPTSAAPAEVGAFSRSPGPGSGISRVTQSASESDSA
jgi:hypothetical protein